MVDISEGKSITLDVGGKQVRTHYYELGPQDKDTVIFMQTGGAGTSAYMCWHKNMPAFAEAGYRVLAPDAPGFGDTEVVSGEGPVNAVEFTCAFMDAVGVQRSHFIGNSMGTMTITRLSVEHPERVLSGIHSGGEPRIETVKCRAIAQTLGRTPRMDFVREMLSKPKVMFEDLRQATAAFFYDADHPVIDEVTRMRLEDLNRPGVRERERDAAFRQIQGGRSDFEYPYLMQVQAPSYLVHGRDERLFYTEDIAPTLLESAMEVALAIPNCSCTVLARCGHWPQLERTDTYNKLCLEFLGGISN